MTEKRLPFTRSQIERIAREYPTPFHLYVEQGIRETARRLNQAFAWAPAFKEYFAVKAAPNPHLLQVLHAEGCGADCSSGAELATCERLGIRGEEIMFTSNATPAEEFRQCRELGGIVNLDDLSHLPFLEAHAGVPELICFRYNPGPARTGNVIIGKPSEAKFGLTRPQLFEAYRQAREKGARRFGLHTMVVSNELNVEFHLETARMLFALALELKDQLGLRVEFVNLGGGIGIPYRPEQTALDVEKLGAGVQGLYQEMVIPGGLHPLKICMENGRAMTGPHGFLVTTVRHIKDTYRKFVGVDACMADLMRPGMYGAYHHLTVLGKEDQPATECYDVTGSLCENNDKFAVERKLPKVDPGDLLVIHDAGAHGHAMGFNYNGKLRHAELLLRPNGSVQLIRRAETLDDYFGTVVWPE